MKIDPGAIGFTSGFSQEHTHFTVGERIIVEELTELSIVIRPRRIFFSKHFCPCLGL